MAHGQGGRRRRFRGGGLLCSLAECGAGEEAVVVDVASESAVATRLREIGMVSGASLRVVRRGSPMIVQLGNTRFCLRGGEAALVSVRIDASLGLGLGEPLLPVG